MGSSVYNWIIVFEDGSTKMSVGDTPECALDLLDYIDQCNIVGIIRNDFAR